MFRAYRFLLAWGAVALLLLGALPARTASAQDRRCFVETNQCIEGRFREYWEQGGGLPVFGFPITPAREELNRDTGKTYLTQWFERNRFEFHPENARPYDVLLGRLGEDTLIKMGRDWRAEYREIPLPSGECELPWVEGKMIFLCPPFRDYYYANGVEFDRQPGVAPAESLALFGLPLTHPKMETNSSGDTVLTQWFERARIEYHPNKPQPYKVLLGLLGNELRKDAPQTPAPAPQAHPTIPFAAVDNKLFELRPGGQTTEIGALPALGRVFDSVQRGDELIFLHERGLVSAARGRGPRTIATFTQGAATGGYLVTTGNSNKVLYVYTRAATNQMGWESVAGVIENGAARKVRQAANNMLALGLTADGRGMYVIDQGQDPSFVTVKLVYLETGRVQVELPYAGEGAVALAPDGATVAAVSFRGSELDSLTFYTSGSATGGPFNVTPKEGWNVAALRWAPSGRVVYATLYPRADTSQGELWQIDPVTRRSALVARNFAVDTALLGVSQDGRFLLGQQGESLIVVELQTGRTERYSLPRGAVIARW